LLIQPESRCIRSGHFDCWRRWCCCVEHNQR